MAEVTAPDEARASGDGTSAAPGRPDPAAGERRSPRPRDVRQARMAQAFAQVVAVLMRDTRFRSLRLADLEWLVIPPVMAGQYRLGHGPTAAVGAEKSSMFVPMAVALWARVSPQVDKALSENLDKQVWLEPDQWASGSILWLMAAAGDRRALPRFLEQLRETEFAGQPVKYRSRGADGKVKIGVLAASKPAAPA